MAFIILGSIALNVEVRRRMANGIQERTGVRVAWWRIPWASVMLWESDPLTFDAWLAQERGRPADPGSQWRGILLVFGMLAAGAVYVPLVVWHWQFGTLAGGLALLLLARGRSR